MVNTLFPRLFALFVCPTVCQFILSMVSDHVSFSLSSLYTKQMQSKVSDCHKGHAYLAKPGKPVHQAGTACVPVLRSLLEPGKELAGAPPVPLTTGVDTKVPPTPLVINETQPVYLAPQYKTRYLFYRWVGW